MALLQIQTSKEEGSNLAKFTQLSNWQNPGLNAGSEAVPPATSTGACA